MLNALQKATAQAIVNIFETGEVCGDYGRVTVARNDPGHLTYGRSQTTLASGNLGLLIAAYCAAEDAVFAADLRPFLPRFEACDLGLDHERPLHALLRAAGEDPVMQAAQDAFFDRVYWDPAVRAAQRTGITLPLGIAVVYDSRVHGSWPLIRDRVRESHGTAGQGGLDQREWLRRYVEARHAWLAGHSNRLLRRTVYRMEAFHGLMEASAWELDLPLFVRGVRIDAAALASRPVRVSADVAESRLLRLATPYLRGEDVRAVQQALRGHGAPELQADGIFGPASAQAVLAFQRREGLRADGIVGPATLARLGLD